MATERDQFTKFRDRDGDGLMDLEEVKAWIIPPDYDHSEAEAKHLVFEADIDHDNLLTKDEILEKYDIFVGSQVRKSFSSGNFSRFYILGNRLR